MANGYCLLVGLNRVDPALHNGMDMSGGCSQSEHDVDQMQSILEPLGYQITNLKTSEATHDKVMHTLKDRIKALARDDIVIFYYSGHGGLRRNDTGESRGDYQDETLVTYDRDIIDNELTKIWYSACTGARIVVISDCCGGEGIIDLKPPVLAQQHGIIRRMKAGLIHYSACREKGTARDGVFTTALYNAWDSGRFDGDYRQLFMEAACRSFSSNRDQIPQYNEYGPVSNRFSGSKPFEI